MKGEWKLKARSVRGARHRERKMMCQDQYSYEKRGNNMSTVLLDGVGRTDINAKAGKRVADLVASFFHDQVDNIRISDEYTIAFNLMRQIQRLLDQMSGEYGVDQKEFSSTLLAIYLAPEEDYYIACHLGDGIIAMSEDGEHVRVVSEPQNGAQMNQTVLTTSESALGNIRIKKGAISNIRTFVLGTDGFYNCWDDRNNLNNIFINDIKDVKMKEKTDDQTVIKIFWTEDERQPISIAMEG